MLVLGRIDEDKIKEEFLVKFHNRREDASEYEFGSMKGEQLEVWVEHKTCQKEFISRPYLFIQGKWPKRCPYCYPYKNKNLTETDMRYRITKVSKGHIRLKDHKENYSGKQKKRKVTVECKDCDNIWDLNFNNIRTTLKCPNCGNTSAD